MTNIKTRLPRCIFFLFTVVIMVTSLNSCQDSITTNEVNKKAPISKNDIIAFQKAYGISFNAIAQAIENTTYYESAARKHIDQNYNFDEVSVMFKIANEDDVHFRNTYDGMLSYLIGKNPKFPSDLGIANKNWRKIDWNNNGIMMEGDIAIAIGKVTMKNEDNDEVAQSYTMGFKRSSKDELKLIMHKVSKVCQ